MPVLRALFAALAAVPILPAQVSFPTQDGGLIFADSYGAGVRAVVLVHGGRFDKGGWQKQATVLAAAGFHALAIDFRGEGQSRGAANELPSDDRRRFDVLGAVHYLRNSGAKTVAVIGGSMGGDYACEAAQAEPGSIDRLVLLGAGAYTPLTAMKGPKLFILARDDANAEGPRLPKIRVQYEKAIEPKQIVILPGSAHAQFLFDTDQGPRVMNEILRFLSSQ